MACTLIRKARLVVALPYPRVEAAWGSLEDGAIAAIRSPGTVVRPNGAPWEAR